MALWKPAKHFRHRHEPSSVVHRFHINASYRIVDPVTSLKTFTALAKIRYRVVFLHLFTQYSEEINQGVLNTIRILQETYEGQAV